MEKKKRTSFSDAVVACCPYCSSAEFKKDGIDSGRQRFRCKECGSTFTALIGTFLANTKKSEKAWQRYVIFLTNELTIKAAGEIGNVNRLKGISRKKIAVEVLGNGKPIGKEILKAFKGHIEKGSNLVRYAFHGHSELVEAEKRSGQGQATETAGNCSSQQTCFVP